MNKLIASIIVVAVLFFGSIFTVGGYTLSVLNQEAQLSTTIHAKHDANLAEYSNLKSKIKETAQVSEKEAETISNIILGYADNRGGAKGGGLINALAEAVPNVNIATLQNLQNIIVGSRNTWTARQTELTSLSQKHNELFAKPLSGVVLTIFGKETIDITIVATGQSREDFESGVETEQDIF